MKQADFRIDEIRIETDAAGTCPVLPFELKHGARMAWLNRNRCVGYLFWKSLKVRDLRQINTDDAVYDALGNHLRYATNNRRDPPGVEPVCTAYPDHPKHPITLANHYLVRYTRWETHEDAYIDNLREAPYGAGRLVVDDAADDRFLQPYFSSEA